MGRTSFKVASHLVRDSTRKRLLTQAEVAEKIGIHLTRYQNIEWKGTTSPKTARKLAELGISVDALQQGLEAPDLVITCNRSSKRFGTCWQKAKTNIFKKHFSKPLLKRNSRPVPAKKTVKMPSAIFAEDIAQRIEAVQLVQNKKKLPTWSN